MPGPQGPQPEQPKPVAPPVPTTQAPVARDTAATNAALCDEGMVWVHARRCSASRSNDDDCPEKLVSVSVCMDAFEYPNIEGALPATMVSFQQAEAACAAEKKRLCSGVEWAAACQRLSDRRGCNVGTKSSVADSDLYLRRPENVPAALAAIDRRRSNTPAGCVTESGVHNLLGNLREWVDSHVESSSGALRGGAHGEPIWSCSRSLRIGDRAQGFPNAGFRCCSRPLVTLPDDL